MPIEVPDNIWVPIGTVATVFGLFAGGFKWAGDLIKNVKVTESTARHALAGTMQASILNVEKRLDEYRDTYAKASDLRETETRIGAQLTEIKGDIRRLQEDVKAQGASTGSNLARLGETIAGLAAVIKHAHGGGSST